MTIPIKYYHLSKILHTVLELPPSHIKLHWRRGNDVNGVHGTMQGWPDEAASRTKTGGEHAGTGGSGRLG